MTIQSNVGSLLGFARKSGTLLSGESAVQTGLKKKKVRLVILAADLQEKRRTNYMRWCEDEGVSCKILGTKKELGQILGMSDRGIIAVIDKQMAIAIENQLNDK